MARRPVWVLLLGFSFFATSAFAINPNEAPGEPTNAVLLGGPGADAISVYSGDLELSVPIGPTWELPGMSWGLSLNYSSKLWRLWTNQAETGGAGTLGRRGPYGVGWRLTMGRVFLSCRHDCDLWNPLYYEDSRGTLHPIHLNTTTLRGNIMDGQTTDGTYMRVEAELSDANPPVTLAKVIQYRIYPGNGVVMIFDLKPADEQTHPGGRGYPDDFGGMLLRRMEKRGPDATTVYSWVEVGYEGDPNHLADPNLPASDPNNLARAHCIAEIKDGIGSSSTPLRTITFTNATTITPSGGAAVPVEGGYTTAITMPAVRGQASVTATYRLGYYDPRPLSFSEGGLSATHQDQLLLHTIDLPTEAGWGGNYSYSFDYDESTGELISQTVPTGAEIFYSYDTYSFLEGFQGVYTREVTKKCLDECDPNISTNRWSYSRYHGNATGPSLTVVKDPFGNQTKYVFYDLSDVAGNNGWVLGLTKRVEVYRGAPLNEGGVLMYPGRIVRQFEQGYWNFGTPPVDDVRVLTSTTTYPDTLRQTRMENSGVRPYGHFDRTVEFSFESSEVPERTTERVYQEPAAGSDRWKNWVIEALTDEKVKDRAGVTVRRSQWTYRDDGKVLTSRRLLDPNAPGSGDLLTTFTYNASTGMPDTTTVSFADGTFPFITRTGYSGGYPTSKRTLKADGSDYPYLSYDVTRDSRTGAILRSREPHFSGTGIETNFEYDILGRLTKSVPPSPELPTEITYANIKTTKTVKGSADPDKIETWTYLDEHGRPLETRRLNDATHLGSRFTCYDAVGRPTFVSEWREVAAGADPWSGACPTVGTGTTKGTVFEYKSYEDDLWATDPLGRLQRTLAADGSRSVMGYSALDSTVTAFNINGVPPPDPNAPSTGTSATTGYQRDSFGRLIYVDAPEGADARYTYSAVGDLLRVELLESVEFGPPFIQVRTFDYDRLGRLLSSTNPESGTVRYTQYDAGGNVLEKVESDGTLFNMAYDEAGRLVTLESRHRDEIGNYGPPVLLAGYEYDDPSVVNGAGKLTKVSSYDEAGALAAVKTFDYSGLNGRLKRETTAFALWDGLQQTDPITGLQVIDPVKDPAFSTCYVYSDLGLLGNLRYPSRSACDLFPSGVANLTYHYEFGRLVGMDDSGTGRNQTLVTSVLYNTAGGLSRIDYGNGVTTEIPADPMFRPSQMKVLAPGAGTRATYLDTGAYVYDGVGNINSMGLDTFGYDLIGRLTSATIGTTNDGTQHGQPNVQRGWTYDDFGNILVEEKIDEDDAVTFQVDPLTNRIVNLGDSGQPFLYDGRGNLNRDYAGVEQRYLFDRRNRLLAVKKPNHVYPVGAYEYDASGMRFCKQDPETGRRTFYVRDGGGNVLSEFIPSPAGLSQGFWQHDYYYALGRVIGHAEETAPKPVEGLTAKVTLTAGSPPPIRVELNWLPNAELDLQGYLVYRKIWSQGAWVQSTPTPLPPSTNTWSEIFPNGEVRYYRVSALNLDGQEGTTSRVVGAVAPYGVIETPTGFVAETTPSAVTLRWERHLRDTNGYSPLPSTIFYGYNVWRNDDPNNPYPT